MTIRVIFQVPADRKQHATTFTNTKLDTHETYTPQKDTGPVQIPPIMSSGTCKHTHSLRSRMCNYTYTSCSTHAHARQCRWAAMRHARSPRDVRCRQHMLTPAESARDPGAPAQTAGSRTPATRRVHRVSARRADVTVTLARSQHARCGRCRHSRARNAKRGAGAHLRREWTRNHGACCSLADQEAAHRRAEISTQSATTWRARAA